MRQLLLAVAVVVTGGALRAAAEDKAVIKGPHICCKNCVKAVDAILAKVDGVSEVKADVKTKTVTFTAKDQAAAVKAMDAMIEGGFDGTLTFGDKELKRAATKVEGKADTVTIKGVHVCCGQCQKAIKGLFPNAEFAGSGAQRDVTITGTDLVLAEVLQKLNEKGFSGKIDKK